MDLATVLMLPTLQAVSLSCEAAIRLWNSVHRAQGYPLFSGLLPAQPPLAQLSEAGPQGWKRSLSSSTLAL